MAADDTNKDLEAEYARLAKTIKVLRANAAKRMEEDRAITKAAEQQQHA